MKVFEIVEAMNESSDSFIASTISKAIHKLGVASAHNWQQMQSNDNFEKVFEVVEL